MCLSTNSLMHSERHVTAKVHISWCIYCKLIVMKIWSLTAIHICILTVYVQHYATFLHSFFPISKCTKSTAQYILLYISSARMVHNSYNVSADILSIALSEPFFYTSTDNTKLLALLIGIELTNNIEFTSFNYHTNKCTYIKFHIKTLKIAPTCFYPKIIFRELHFSLLKSHFKNTHWLISSY